MEKCLQEKRIGRIEKMLDGNGQPGIVKTLEKLNLSIDHHTEVLCDYKKVINAHNKYMYERDAIEKEKEKRKHGIIAIIGMIMGLIGAIIGKFL
jgi:hypothetical protein